MRPSSQAALWSSVGIVVVVAAVWVVLAGGDRSGGATPSGQGAGSGGKAAAAPADPMQDAAAWKALSAPERAAKLRSFLGTLDRKSDSALWYGHNFLKERGETDGVRQVCTWAIERDAAALWARDGLGHEDVRKRVEQALDECATADEMDVPAFHRLKEFRAKHEPATGKWWADAQVRGELDKILAELRAAEETLKDPYTRAIAKWEVYQRKLEVMREHPSVRAFVGPYLIFVQLRAPANTPFEKIDPAEVTRANRVLNQNVKLFEAFYAGWTKEMAPLLGLTKYGPGNVDEKTLLKANIFADETTWRRYHERRGLASAILAVRAYYEADEPRFIVSHDGPSREDPEYTDQVQCHEATHQLVHFHTWDQTRKASGREPPWADCNTVPLWNSEGFAEFFSAHVREGTTYRWMQPLAPRLRDIWAFSEALTRKQWAPIGLAELLDVRDYADLNQRAARRVTPKPYAKQTPAEKSQVATAVPLFSNLFYARSWSFVHFLWFAQDANGRPQWRDRYVSFLKRQMSVEYVQQAKLGLVPRTLDAADLRKALGVEDEAAFQALEREWKAFEASLVEKHKKRDWPQYRDQVLATLGLE